MREGAEGGDVSGGYGKAYEKRQPHGGAAMSLCQEKSRTRFLLDQGCLQNQKAIRTLFPKCYKRFGFNGLHYHDFLCYTAATDDVCPGLGDGDAAVCAAVEATAGEVVDLELCIGGRAVDEDAAVLGVEGE